MREPLHSSGVFFLSMSSKPIFYNNDAKASACLLSLQAASFAQKLGKIEKREAFPNFHANEPARRLQVTQNVF